MVVLEATFSGLYGGCVVVLEATFSGLYGGCVVVLEAIVASASPAAPRPRRLRAAARPPPVARDVGTCHYRPIQTLGTPHLLGTEGIRHLLLAEIPTKICVGVVFDAIYTACT